jgi:hypothetical protein
MYYLLHIFDLLLDLIPWPSIIGPFAHHNFIHNNPKSIEIDLEAMILMKKHFRGHIPWSTWGVFFIIFSKISRNSKISEIGLSWLSKCLPLPSKTIFSGLISRWMINF